MLIKDKNTWNKIIQEKKGYIYNDFGTQFPGNSPTWNTPDFNKLHHITCGHVRRMTYLTDGKLTKHYFETRAEAIEWLEKNRKHDGYSFCKYCAP